MKKYILSIIAIAYLTGCNSFLEEQPSKNTQLPISSIEQLDALLGNYSMYVGDRNRHAVAGTDDWGLTPELYQALGATTYAHNSVLESCWDTQFLPFDGREDCWSGEYKKIFHANMVLSYLDKVTGSDTQKADLRAEAHLIRAYSYWMLSQTYCLPYTETTKGEPGVPLKQTVNFEENVDRGTLEALYLQIEADLAEALKAENNLVVNGVHRAWRGNKSAAKAFAARYYMSRNNYTEALKYANAALADHSDLVDYNTEMKYSDRIVEIIVKGEKVKIDFPETYNSSDAERLRWKESYLARASYYGTAWYIPSRELLDLYDKENDLRYKYHIVEHYSYFRKNTNPDYPGYIFFGQYDIPSGPTTSEMLLVKAECQARAGQWQEGLKTMEILRTKRIATANYKALPANSKEEAIRIIIDERRRERPFTFRWYDARRLNSNADTFDDVTFSKTFYPYNESTIQSGETPVKYEMKPGNRTWARPVPSTEVESSQGAVPQNKY